MRIPHELATKSQLIVQKASISRGEADHILKNQVVFVNDMNDQITESKSLKKNKMKQLFQALH